MTARQACDNATGVDSGTPASVLDARGFADWTTNLARRSPTRGDSTRSTDMKASYMPRPMARPTESRSFRTRQGHWSSLWGRLLNRCLAGTPLPVRGRTQTGMPGFRLHELPMVR